MTPTELADLIAAAAADKKAREVVILDLRGKTTIADFFVICEGDTDRQVRAIVDNIEAEARDRGVRPLNVAGLRDASWACLDFDSVIAHVSCPASAPSTTSRGWGVAPARPSTHWARPRGLPAEGEEREAPRGKDLPRLEGKSQASAAARLSGTASRRPLSMPNRDATCQVAS
jgi:ribosome-associated protein